ncbi:MAG: cyclic nucleotide-binding domain-containing protein [Leptospiraceae bacterium]|nr:cyclic nucleotide-binding domain-containing protein [Leptospiraceae bacterium]MCP5513479.1 cyclic nucleotide-binding domain-containing protein [Leptospiraceae bacterium]
MIQIADFLREKDIQGYHYNKNELIYSKGEKGKLGVGFVLKGSVTFYANMDSEEKNPIIVYPSGNFFGYHTLIFETRLEYAVVEEDDTIVIFLSLKDFQDWLKSSPVEIGKLLNLLILSLRNLDESILKSPEKPLDISELFGEEVDKTLTKIRKENLKITEHLNTVRSRTVLNKENVFLPDDEKDSHFVYLLIEGEIEQYRIDDNQFMTEVIHLRPGALFGFLRIKNMSRHFLTAKAINGSAKIAILDSDILIRLSRVDFTLAYNILLNLILTVLLIQKSLIKNEST